MLDTLVPLPGRQVADAVPVGGRRAQHVAVAKLADRAARQRNELSKPARDLLARLSIEAPRKIHELTTGT
jgi:hypothetical protein